MHSCAKYAITCGFLLVRAQKILAGYDAGD